MGNSKNHNTQNESSTQLRINRYFKVIIEILKILSGLGVTGSVILMFFKNNRLWLIPMFSFILIFILLYLLKKYKRKIAIQLLNLFSADLPYKILSKEAIYIYKSSNEMAYLSIMEILPLQKGMDKINTKFLWTGESENNQVCLTPIKSNKFEKGELEYIGNDYGYKRYVFRTNEIHYKGDKPFCVAFRIAGMHDKDHKASHHLLTNIDVVTNLLIQKAQFPANLKPCKVIVKEFLHSSSDYHIKVYYPEVCYKHKKWIVTSKIYNPIMGGKYIMTWEFENTFTSTTSINTDSKP